ncbi:MAG: TonB-dependent receptor [Tannerellaceae bacterium]|nr:TonB-dependent receptor [Tannerellaceae bacterium]
MNKQQKDRCKKYLKIRIMIFIAVLLTAGIFHASAIPYAQEQRISVNVQNGTFYDVVMQIEKQSEFMFFYKSEEIDDSRSITVEARDKLVSDVLNDVLKSRGLTYRIVDRHVIITKSTPSEPQQSRRITGIVTDGAGEAVIGANVLEKGTTNGVITDMDGKFTLSVNGNATLIVSYIGFITQEIQTNGKTTFSVRLEEDNKSLDEVVVVGYGSVKKSDLTGAVAKVSTEDLLQLSTTDIGQALQGRVAGVDIISDSGQPGSGVKIRIRGYGSINNSDPLYVVDGFPVSDINHIAPQDIESMEILKDASATAIYGSRGANGVVLIQTKKGGFDRKPVFSFNVYGSMSNVVRTIDVLNAWQFATLKREALVNAGMPIDPTMDAQFSYVTDNKLKGTDWEKEAIRTGYSQNYNVNINGGGTRTAYDFGVTYSNEQGVTRFNDVQTLIARANNTYKLSSKIEFNLNLTYTHRDRRGQGNNMGFSTDYQGGNGNYYGAIWPSILAADPFAPAWDSYTENWGEIVYSDVNYQPARTLNESSSKYVGSASNIFSANASLQFSDLLIKGLSFRTQYGVRSSFDERTAYQPVYYIAANQQRQRSQLSLSKPKGNSWLWNGFFTYLNTFNKRHSVSATLGAELQERGRYMFSASAYDVPEQSNMWYLSQTADATSYTASSSASWARMASFFIRANYSLSNKYLLTATARADGSSKFIDKWGYFPSFSLGWNVHEEAFAKDNAKWLSQLKARLGYGLVGNEASAGNNDYIALMNNGYTAALGGINRPGSVQQAIPNEHLTWEAAEQLNMGIDFGVHQMKLTGTVDYFVRTTKDMILATPIPQYVGMWRARTNAGKMRNTGLEVSLKWQDRKGKLSYSIAGNASFVTNEVLDLGSPDPIYGENVGRIQQPFTRTEVGMPMGYFYGYKTDGLFQTQEEVNAYTYTGDDGKQYPIQPNAAPGDVRFVKTSGDGKALNENDRVFLGTAMPDVSFGINGNIGYRNIDFMVFFQGVVGNEIANAKVMDLYSSNMIQWNMSTDMMNRWTGAGTSNEYPRMHAGDPNMNIRFSDRYIEDGSYLRIRNIQIGYSFPKSILTKMKLTRLRLYASVDNLHVFTSYRGFDPEMGDYLGNPLNSGVDMGAYPRPRTITAGLNLTF